MRATRAYFASIGTTGLLVLAALVILVTASALLTFDGWPGNGTSGRTTPVLIDPGREVAAQTGPARVAAAAVEAADEVALAPETGDSAPGGGGGDDDAPAGDRPGDTPRGGGPDSGPAPTPQDPAVPGEPAPGSDRNPRPPERGGVQLPGGGTLLGGSGGPSLTDGVADGVESTTNFLGDDVVGQLNPDLGTVVTDTGQALTDLVRGLDGSPAAPRR